MATIITRSGKGSPLTNTEVDNNFTNLNTAKYESGDSASFGGLSLVNINPQLTIQATTDNWAALNIQAGDTQANYVFFRDAGAERARITVLNNNDLSFSTSANQQRLLLSATSTIFNEQSYDTDFRVESDTSNNAFFLDAGNSRVGINNGNPNYDLEVGNQNDTVTRTISIASSGSAEKRLVFRRSTVDDWVFKEDTSENFSIDGLAGKELVINQAGADVNFRVESDTNEYALFVDAANSTVSVGSASSDTIFNVYNNTNASAGIHVENLNAGTAARTSLTLRSDGGSFFMYAAGSNYSGVSGWADSGILSTSSDLAGGVKINSQVGGIEFQDGTVNRFHIKDGGEIVANETGQDRDFRIESDSNANMFVVDAQQNRVTINSGGNAKEIAFSVPTGIGILGGRRFITTLSPGSINANTPLYVGSIETYFNGDSAALWVDIHATGQTSFISAKVIVRNGSGTVIPSARAYQTSVSGWSLIGYVDNANSGMIHFYIETTSTVQFTPRITVSGVGSAYYDSSVPSSPVDEDYVWDIGETFAAKLKVGGSAVFNEDGGDYDFRVESDTNPYMLFVDAGANHVNIGTSSDFGGVLNVAGDMIVQSTGLGKVEITSSSANSTDSAALDLLEGAGGFGNAEAYGFRLKYDGNANKFEVLGGNQTSVYKWMDMVRDNGYTTFYNDAGTERFHIGTTDVVVNESSADYDFRVESDLSTHALFVDAQYSVVGVNTSITDVQDVGGGLVVNSNTQSNEGAIAIVSASYKTGAAGQAIGGLTWHLGGTVGERTSPAGGIYGYDDYVTGGAYAGSLRLYAYNTNSLRLGLSVQASDVVVNDDGLDRDFRVESDTNTHALFVDAGNSAVSINSSSIMGTGLHVSGATNSEYRTLFVTNPADVTKGVAIAYDLTNDRGVITAVDAGTGWLPLYIENTSLTIDGGLVVNEAGSNSDFRVESDTNSNALYVDGQTGQVGVGTATLDASLSLGNDLVLNLGSNEKRDYYGKYIDPRTVGDGTYAGYLLLVPYNPGPTAVTGAAMMGRFLASRGNSNNGNNPATCEVLCSATYTNTYANMRRAGTIDYFKKLVRVTYSGTEYVALEFAQTNGSAANGIYYYGWALRADSNFLFMARDTEVTGVTDYRLPSYDIDAIGSNTFENNTVFNEASQDADFRVESDTNNVAFVVDGNANTAYFGGTPSFSGANANVGVLFEALGSDAQTILTANKTNTNFNVAKVAGYTNSNFFNFYVNSAAVGSIATTGSTTAYNTSSDARLKTNIKDAHDAGELIDAIQVRQFNWKVDNSHQRYGMVAQELLEVAPEAVSGEPDGEEMMGVDYSKLVPMLVKEIQTLRARIAALEAK